VNGAAEAALAAGVGVAAVAAVKGAMSRRALTRRLSAVAARLEGRAPGPTASPVPDDGEARSSETAAVDARGGAEQALARLERAADEAAFRSAGAAEAADRVAAALQHVGVGVVVWDEHGAEVYRNDAATTLLGTRHGEALAEQLVGRLLAGARQGQPSTEPIDLFGPPRRTLVVAAFPLDDERRTTGAAAVIEDVSGRRRLEAVRRDFVANVSHELKTPVGAIGLLAETLVDERDPVVVRRLSKRMHTESLRLGRTIEDLLDLSRIEAEEAPAREPLPVHLLVAEAAERVRELAGHRRIELEVDEPDHGVTVLGDRRQLVSALHNLLENAVKYSDDESAVELCVGTAPGGAGWLDVVVRDHGIGIPARDLERIFVRFYRVDRARSRETGGTGLGLSIVRHVAANHGGQVLVESREGEGSTFTLRLPASAPRGLSASGIGTQGGPAPRQERQEDPACGPAPASTGGEES